MYSGVCALISKVKMAIAKVMALPGDMLLLLGSSGVL